MKQACYIRNNNLHEREHHDLSSCQNRNMQVSTFAFLSKLKYLIIICMIFLSTSAFAVSNLSVSGITGTYSTANGIYVYQSVDSHGYNIWKHQTLNYYIWEYWDGTYPWWLIDTDTDGDNGVIYQSSSEGYSTPTEVLSWEAYLGEGSPVVAYYSVNPEINLSANGSSISSGDNTPSFTEHTKFGSALPNSGTATRTFTIQNTGSAALTIGTISFSGANPTEFSVTTAPAASVAASGSTTFTVTFAPTGTGDRNATISIGNNDSDESTYAFSLNGYGYTVKALVVSGITTPVAANGNYISQGILNNFQYWKHATENYYIFNYLASGVSPTWAIDNDQVGTNGILFYYVSEAVSPNGLTPWQVQYGTGSPVVSEATPTPEINVVGNNSQNIASGDNSPSRYDGTNFGSLDYSSGTRTRTYTIQNTGTATLTLSGSSPYVSLSGATSDFSVTTAPANSVAASSSTTFVVTFNPTSEGTKTAVVTITNNDSDEGSYTFTIQGDGYTTKNVVLSGVTSPSVLNGTYIHQGLINEYQYWKYGSYYIYNSDNGGTVDGFWYIDNDIDRSAYYFRSSNNNESGFPVNVTSWSSTGGSGSPVIQYAEPEMNVTGNSTTIVDEDASASIYDHTDFGYTDIAVGTIVRTFTIQNTGTETLTLTGITPYVVVGGADASYFTVTSAPSASIAAGGSTTFNITFDPNALREFNATLSIANNDATENPYNFSINGTGSALPTITTQAVSSITTTTATGNGNITDLGSSNPTAYGVCWNTTGTPTISDNKVDKGAASATGAFTASMTGLTVNTTYYVRAYATNTVGTSYGTEVAFKTKATPVITWNNPSDIVYGTLLSATQLNATASVSGTFTYTPALGTKLNVGTAQNLKVDFTPTDATNYTTATKTVTIDVAKAAPAITWANPSGITYGTLLSATQLNATADVAGTFTYTPALGTKLNAGTAQNLKVDFTPTDATNYTTATKTVTIDVAKAAPAITWANPSGITYGTLLSATQLNATADVAGTFTYTPALGTKLNAGAAQNLKIDFTPSDATNYTTATKTVTIDVAKATPVITWSNPTDITYGTTLSATQLNATADVAGTYTYTPALETKLNAGTAQNLKVDFTPDDATNYNTATKTVTIDVAKASPVITWSNPADINNATALSNTQLNASADVSGTFTYTPAIGVKLNVGNAQALKVDFVPSDLINYESASKTVLINVFLATGITEVENNESIVLYPNPVMDAFSVLGIEDKLTISLSDLNGKVVLTKVIYADEKVFVSDLSSGIYLIKIITSNGTILKKIVKE